MRRVAGATQRFGSGPSGGRRLSDFAARTRLLCWIWAGVVLIFFALSTNQEYYTFPAYLPLLLLLADGVAQCERTECERGVRAGWLTTSAGLLAVIGVAASAILLVGVVEVAEPAVRARHWRCAGRAGY